MTRVGAIELTVQTEARIRLRGDLDCLITDQVPDLLTALADTERLVEVDAGDLRFIDACGSTALLRLVGARPSRPQLTAPPPILTFLLDVAQRWDSFAEVPGVPAGRGNISGRAC